jgi:hypothetical protein
MAGGNELNSSRILAEKPGESATRLVDQTALVTLPLASSARTWSRAF